MLADEENHFLLESETSESNDVKDTDNFKDNSNSKYTRNSSNLIVINCDKEGEEEKIDNDVYDDEDDERRHAKFKSERVISLNNKNNVDRKDIPDNLESVVINEKDAKNLKSIRKGKNFKPFTQRNVSKNQIRPLLPQNFASLGLNNSSPYKIHVNPHFRAPGPSKSSSNIINQQSIRRMPMFKPRMPQPLSRLDPKSLPPLLPTPLSSFDANPGPTIPHNLIPLPTFAEQIISNHSNLDSSHDPDFQMFGNETSHKGLFLPQEPNGYWQQPSEVTKCFIYLII